MSQVKGLISRYNELYKAISVTGTFLEDGKYQCQVLLEGSPVKVSAVPKATSNCASQVSVRPDDGRFIIAYNAVDCLPEEDNLLDITFVINGKRIQHRAFLNESGASGVSFR